MMNELKLQVCRWRFEVYRNLKNRALNNAKKHCINGNEDKTDEYMEKAQYYRNMMEDLSNEAESLIELEEVKACFWN